MARRDSSFPFLMRYHAFLTLFPVPFFISLSWRELFTSTHLFASAISLALRLVAVFIFTWFIGIFKGFVQLFSTTVIFAIGLFHWPVHRFVVRKIIRSSRRNV